MIKIKYIFKKYKKNNKKQEKKKFKKHKKNIQIKDFNYHLFFLYNPY